MFYEILTFSDSVESAEREIAVFFKDFNIKEWCKNEAIHFQMGKVHFDPLLFIHTVDNNDLDTTKYSSVS